MFKKTCLIILTAGMLIYSVQTLFAQPRPGPEKREMVRERIETLRVWKMIEFLDLTQEQSDQFLPLLREFQKTQEELDMAKKELFQNLKNELESDEPDEEKIKNMLTQLEKNKEAEEKARKDFLTSSGKTLTTIQEARLVLFDHIFERKMKETLRNLRMKHGPGGFGEG